MSKLKSGGSLVERLTRDRRVEGSSLAGGLGCVLELVDWDVKNLNKQMSKLKSKV